MGSIDRLNGTSVKTALKRIDEQQDFDFRLMEEILDQYTGSPNSDYEKRIRRLHMWENGTVGRGTEYTSLLGA